MQIQVVTEEGREVVDPFLLRLGEWTEDRYWAEAPEDRLWEFQDGELIVHSPATPGHQRVVGFLTFLLRGFVEERSLGEVFNGPAVLRLRPGANKEPDLFFLRHDHGDRVGPARVDGPADFVIEVTSPGTRSYDLGEKAQVYRDAGVAEYWAVDTERREVAVHRAGESEYRVAVLPAGRLESTAVRGFWIEVGWLWQKPLPSGPVCLREVLGQSLA
ncbi:MAG: Uma2 family endonuclease [Gemmatimonadetes bacterium]|nr:Uma2 family endonuclease [Gemmatimonadota bacterium]